MYIFAILDLLEKCVPENLRCYVVPTLICAVFGTSVQLIFLNFWWSPNKMWIYTTWAVLIWSIVILARIFYESFCALSALRGILHANIYYGIESWEGRKCFVDLSRWIKKRLNYVDELNNVILGTGLLENYEEERDVEKLKNNFLTGHVKSNRINTILSYSTWLRYYPQKQYNPQNNSGSTDAEQSRRIQCACQISLEYFALNWVVVDFIITGIDFKRYLKEKSYTKAELEFLIEIYVKYPVYFSEVFSKNLSFVSHFKEFPFPWRSREGVVGNLWDFLVGRTYQNKWFEMYEQTVRLDTAEALDSVGYKMQCKHDWTHFIKLRILGDICRSIDCPGFPTRFRTHDAETRVTRVSSFADPPDESDWKMIMNHLEERRRQLDNIYKTIDEDLDRIFNDQKNAQAFTDEVENYYISIENKLPANRSNCVISHTSLRKYVRPYQGP